MKKVLALLLMSVLALSLVACGGANAPVEPQDEAQESETIETIDNSALEQAMEKEVDLKSAIDTAQAVLDSGKLPLDEETLLDLESTITDARTVIVPLDGRSEQELKNIDYSQQINLLNDKRIGLENSIKQLEQVTNPSEDFVIERIKDIPTIKSIAAVTEDHDPNGRLGKQGGYTASIYFVDKRVDQNEVIGNTTLEKGTDGGGCIEVYATVEDAEKRNTELAAYDGTILASGSHYIIGTVLVRTSNNLKASQQKELTEQIINSLTELR